MKSLILVSMLTMVACSPGQASDDTQAATASEVAQMSRMDTSVVDVSAMMPDAVKMFHLARPAAACSQTFCSPYACGGDDCTENLTADLLCQIASCDGSVDSECNQRFYDADWQSCERKCSQFEDDAFIQCHNNCMNNIRRTCLSDE